MADYDDKKLGALFPTRSGQSQGGATERQMLDNKGGSDSFRTGLRTNPDGSTTLLRTRDGMPRFTTQIEEEDSGTLPRGLCAYPFDMANHLSWSKPCILDWDVELQVWKTIFYNPPQTSDEVPGLPSVNEGFKVSYWFDGEGNVSLCSNKKIFYGKRHAGNEYSSWTTGTAVVGNQDLPAIPFVGYAKVLSGEYKKFILEQTLEHTKLMSGNTELYDHYQERDYGGDTGIRAYDIQLPMSVTLDGNTVLMQSATALRWGNLSSGFYDAVKEKMYFVTRLTLPGLSSEQRTVAFPSYGYFDGAFTPSSQSGTNPAGFGDCDSLYVGVYGGSSVGGYFFVGSPGWPSDEFWIPRNWGILFQLPGDTTLSQDTRGGRGGEYLMDTDATFHIGNTAYGTGVEPVAVRVVCSLNQPYKAEGGHTLGITEPPEGGSAYFFIVGESYRHRTKIEVNNSSNDVINVIAAVGPLSVNIYEHNGSAQASALYENKSVFRQNVDPILTEGYPSFHECAHVSHPSASDGQGVDDIGDSGSIWIQVDGVKAYQRDGPGAISSVTHAWPTMVDEYNLSQQDNQWHDTIDDGSYTGTAQFSATSRTIIVADAALDFVAFVEVIVSSSVSFSAPPPSWHIGQYSSQLINPHAVSARIIVRFQGIEYAQDLFSLIVTKIGIWDLQEIEDWHQWPWANTMPGSMNIVASPRMWPDANKMKQVDNIFYHQGVSKDLAGILAVETGDPQDVRVIFAKRFRMKDISANWLIDEYGITEPKRGATDASPEEERAKYYYCPELKPLIEETYYQIEFDHSGLRVWVGDMASRTTINIADKENRDAVCYRV